MVSVLAKLSMPQTLMAKAMPKAMASTMSNVLTARMNPVSI